MISQIPSSLNKWMSFHVRERWMDGWMGGVVITHWSHVTCDMWHVGFCLRFCVTKSQLWLNTVNCFFFVV